MIYILFHARSVRPFRPCIDGIFSAIAGLLAHPEAKLIPAVYVYPPKLNLKPGDRVYLLDLTYPAPVIEKWADVAEVVILDHHKSAMQDLSGLSDRVFKTFDMARSGAVISWEYFHSRSLVPDLYRYVQDRDIWTKLLPNVDTVNWALVDSFDDRPFEECVEIAKEMLGKPIEAIVEMGRQIEVEIDEAVQGAVKKARFRTVLGYDVAYFRCKTKREFQGYSDIGNALARAYPRCAFAVVQTGNGWGLRSSGFDVSRVAKMIGGGGRVAASGCEAELPNWIVNIFD